MEQKASTLPGRILRQYWPCRMADGRADCEGDVAKQLACFFLHKQDGQEHGQRCERRGHHRSPDLLGSVGRGSEQRLAHLPVPVDVLEHHDGVVDNQAGGQCDAEQRQRVDAVAQHSQHHKRCTQRYRNGAPCKSGCKE